MAAMNDGDAGRSPRSTLRSSEYDTVARAASACWVAPWTLRNSAIRKPTLDGCCSVMDSSDLPSDR